VISNAERPRIAAVGRAFPRHYYDQDTLIAAFKQEWASRHYNLERIEQLHRNVLVGGRHLALPIEEYGRLETWGHANDAWLRVALDTGERAVREALACAGLQPGDVDALLFVTVTGISTPSLDALLMNRLRLHPGVRRMPVFGLGCLAGAAGVARAADYLLAYPEHVAVLLSVELCSLTLQREDLSIPNLIATGLFGDGAAAAVLAGGTCARGTAAGPRVIASRSVFYPDSEEVMGWRISERGFKVVLSADVPKVVLEHLGGDVDRFLESHDLSRRDIVTWIAHPGGPKVLEAVEGALSLPASALETSWQSLREVGNLSSTSVLLVLDEVMRRCPGSPGEYGLLFAMGPGFCSELVLIRW